MRMIDAETGKLLPEPKYYGLVLNTGHIYQIAQWDRSVSGGLVTADRLDHLKRVIECVSTLKVVAFIRAVREGSNDVRKSLGGLTHPELQKLIKDNATSDLYI